MIKIIDIDQLSVDEIESILNKNEDWQLVSFGANSYMTNGLGLCAPPKRKQNYFMAVKPIVDYPEDFKIPK